MDDPKPTTPGKKRALSHNVFMLRLLQYMPSLCLSVETAQVARAKGSANSQLEEIATAMFDKASLLIWNAMQEDVDLGRSDADVKALVQHELRNARADADGDERPAALVKGGDPNPELN